MKKNNGQKNRKNKTLPVFVKPINLFSEFILSKKMVKKREKIKYAIIIIF